MNTMDYLKYYNTELEKEERNLKYLCYELEAEHTSEAVINNLKENKKATEMRIAINNTAIERIKNKNPQFYNIQCQLCNDFKKCEVTENRNEPWNCQRGFKLIKLESNCNFLYAGKCIFEAVKRQDGHYQNQKYCLPGSCPLKTTPEYILWKKI